MAGAWTTCYGALAIHDLIQAEMPLEPVEPNYHGEVAERYRYADGQGEIGFVASVSPPVLRWVHTGALVGGRPGVYLLVRGARRRPAQPAAAGGQ